MNLQSISWLCKWRYVRQIRLSHTIIVFVLVVLALLMFTFSELVYNGDEFKDKSHRCNNAFDPVYDVVLDAGSTGTRVYVYRFERRHGQELRLRNEYVKRVQPGLSSYHQNVNEASTSLAQLTNFALDQIPGRYRRCTSITLKATAGLRLLPSTEQEQLLEKANTLLTSTSLFNRGSSIISGREEGVYGWLTVNYLLHRLPVTYPTTSHARRLASTVDVPIIIDNTVVTVDMGGGSAQVVFAVREEDVGDWLPVSYTSQLPWGQQRLTLYQNSYLGLGLNEARKELFRSFNSSTDKFACLPHSYSVQVNETVTLSNVGEQSFRECVKLFDTHVLHVERHCSYVACGAKAVPQPSLALSHQAVYVFSYFYDMIYELAPDKNDITVQTFEQVANDVCHSVKPEYAKENVKTTCMDLSYLYAFLHHGLGLPSSRKLYVHHTIDDRAVTWSLGASIAWLINVIL